MELEEKYNVNVMFTLHFYVYSIDIKIEDSFDFAWNMTEFFILHEIHKYFNLYEKPGFNMRVWLV